MIGRVLIIPLLLLLNTQTPHDRTVDCSSARTTIQLEECMERALAREEVLLKRSEAHVRKSLTPPAKAPFDSAASMWRAYRDQECMAVYSDYSGGSVAGSELIGCKIALSEARERSLKVIYMTEK